MAVGAAWMVLFKFIDRCTGIVSTLILARLLLPEDFGLIALANTVIAMLEILGASGLETALVQRTDATRDDFDSVWTFNVIFGLTVCSPYFLALRTTSISPRACPVQPAWS